MAAARIPFPSGRTEWAGPWTDGPPDTVLGAVLLFILASEVRDQTPWFRPGQSSNLHVTFIRSLHFPEPVLLLDRVGLSLLCCEGSFWGHRGASVCGKSCGRKETAGKAGVPSEHIPFL